VCNAVAQAMAGEAVW